MLINPESSGQPKLVAGQGIVGHLSSIFFTPSPSVSSFSGFFGFTVMVALGFEIVFPVDGSIILTSICHFPGGSCSQGNISLPLVIACSFGLLMGVAVHSYFHFPASVFGMSENFSPSSNTVFVVETLFASRISMYQAIELFCLLVLHCVYWRIFDAMSANSHRVIFSSCPIELSAFFVISHAAIAFSAYPYQ